MNEKILEEINKRLGCLILLNCQNEVLEKEKLKIAVNCLGLRETARLLEKDPGNLSKQINKKGKKQSDK